MDQGRQNDIMLLTSAYTKRTPGGAATAAAIARLCEALAHVAFANFKGEQAEQAAIQRAMSKLTANEVAALQSVPQIKYGLIEWMLATATGAAERGDVYSAPQYAQAMSESVLRLRSAIGTLTDLIADSHGPLLFTHLMTVNVTFSFLLFPWAMSHEMGVWIVPAGFVYVLFSDGLLTYATAVGSPFDGRSPLLNLDTIAAEAANVVSKRFPPAAANFPGALETAAG